MPGIGIREREEHSVSVAELKKLLVDLREKKPDVCVRFRFIGELWVKNFLTIAMVTAKGVVLKDRADNRLVIISNLDDVIQFEIDAPFQTFRPHYHYDVTLSEKF
jgi:hypothetical protein